MERKYNKTILPYAQDLRKNMTKEERHLWYDFLRVYPERFLRQRIFGKYIADFYCAKVKLVIELDGSQHLTADGKIYDQIRTEFLEQYNLMVLRVPNHLINTNFYDICLYIDKIVKERLALHDKGK